MSALATNTAAPIAPCPADLRGLIYAKDDSLLRLILPSFEDLGIEVTLCNTVEGAATAISRHKFDCAVIDCEEGGLPHLLLRAFAHSNDNRECVVAAIISAQAAPPPSLMLGAHMTMCRPSSSERALRCLRPLYGEVIQRRRAAFRAQVGSRVSLTVEGTASCPVTVVDIGLTEMTIAAARQPLACGQRVTGTLPLPGASNHPLRVSGDVVWSSNDGSRYGVRLSGTSRKDLRDLKHWLDTEFGRSTLKDEKPMALPGITLVERAAVAASRWS